MGGHKRRVEALAEFSIAVSTSSSRPIAIGVGCAKRRSRASRPHRFPKQALCKVAFSEVRPRQPVALPGRIRALSADCAPLWRWWCSRALVRCSALRFSQWPSAIYLVSAPRPTLGPRRCSALARAVCPSAPQGGLPQPARKRLRNELMPSNNKMSRFRFSASPVLAQKNTLLFK